MSDSSMKIRLHRASELNGPISHYYIIVAMATAIRGRLADSFRVEDVSYVLGFSQ